MEKRFILDVRYWYKADIQPASIDVRFRGKSRHTRVGLQEILVCLR